MEARIVFALTFIAFLLRLIRLGTPALWHDEAISALLALRTPAEIIALTAQDVHPPLYYLLLRFWTLGSQDEWTLRLLSAVCSAATVPLVYLLGQQLFQRRWVGAVAALLCALAPFQITYAQEARMYGLFVFECTLASLLLVIANSDGRPVSWLTYALVMSMALYTDYFAVFLLPAHGLWLWLQSPFKFTRTMQSWLLALLGMIVLYLPWLLTFIAQTRAVISAYWVPPPSPLAPLVSLHLFLIGHALPTSLYAIGLLVSLLSVAFVILALWRAPRPAADRPALIYLLLLFALPIVGAFVFSFVRSIYLDRALLFTAPALYLLIAWMVLTLRPVAMGRVMLGGLLLLMVIGQTTYHLNPRYTKYPLHDVSEWLSDNIEPGDLVLHTSDGSFLPARFYAPALSQTLLPDDPKEVRQNAPSQAIVWALGGAPQPFEQAISGYQRVWLVVMLDHSVEHQLAVRAQMERRYLKLSERDIGGIKILLFNLQASVFHSSALSTSRW